MATWLGEHYILHSKVVSHLCGSNSDHIEKLQSAILHNKIPLVKVMTQGCTKV